MPSSELSDQSLQWWLDHIGSVHLTEIELGLSRVDVVAKKLQLKNPAPHIITVAGTNGKGSVVACLEDGLIAAGKKVGSYTSPHIERYNERIRIDSEPVSDGEICKALASVEHARADVSLSYFEFSTLAALYLFKQYEVDVAVLEVGLGGRLDAVNIVDPDIAIITAIALDHQDWLGDDRETIALEKAGILRPGVPFICGDRDPAASLLEKALELACPIYKVGHEFNIQQQSANQGVWEALEGPQQQICQVQANMPKVIAENAACAFQALILSLGPEFLQLANTIAGTQVAGRQEMRVDTRSGCHVLLDVAHNPAATAELAVHLQRLKDRGEFAGDVIVVLAVMADKDIQDMACSLASYTDIWYIAQVNVPRCMPAKEAAEQIPKSGVKQPVKLFGSVEEAYEKACKDSTAGDLIVVTGSFYTVAAIRAMSSSNKSN